MRDSPEQTGRRAKKQGLSVAQPRRSVPEKVLLRTEFRTALLYPLPDLLRGRASGIIDILRVRSRRADPGDARGWSGQMFEEVFQALLLECAARPLLEAQDMIKFLYQGAFGGEHMLPDRESALCRLQGEWAGLEALSVQGGEKLPFQPLGEGICRLHLVPAMVAGLRIQTVNGLFLAASGRPGDDSKRFQDKLETLEQLASAGRIPADADGMRRALREYRGRGCPAVSHSAAYRRAYHPAYRLAPASAARFLPLFQKIDALLDAKGRAVVAIDGPCASGKSTLGALLETVYAASLVHMDDFFLPPQKRTLERLGEPGGNVDAERFLEEVAEKMRAGSFAYRPFSCKTGALLPPRVVDARAVTVVEGAYSLRPELRKYYDLHVFLDVDPRTQSLRILDRNGPEMHARFQREWIPMENRYFMALRVREACELVFGPENPGEGAP